MICRRSSRAPVVDRLERLRSSLGRQKDEIGAAAAAEPDAVARAQLALGDRLAVDERAVARLAVAQEVAAVVGHDLGVLARDLAAAEPQVVRLAPADRERQPVDGDDPLAEHVADFEAGIRHGCNASVVHDDRQRRRSNSTRRDGHDHGAPSRASARRSRGASRTSQTPAR